MQSRPVQCETVLQPPFLDLTNREIQRHTSSEHFTPRRTGLEAHPTKGLCNVRVYRTDHVLLCLVPVLMRGSTLFAATSLLAMPP